MRPQLLRKRLGLDGTLLQLVAGRITAEARARPVIAGVPAGALVPARRAAQKHPPVLELQQGIVELGGDSLSDCISIS